MLNLVKKDLEDKHRIFIVDIHSHIGRDLDGGHELPSPRVTGGTYNFISCVTNGTLQREGVITELINDAQKHLIIHQIFIIQIKFLTFYHL